MVRRTSHIALAIVCVAYALACAVAFVALPARADTQSELSQFRVTDDVAAPLTATKTRWDWQHAVQIVANLRAQRPKTPVVVLLGGSSARECITDEKLWTKQIVKMGGSPDVVAYDLGSRNRTYALDLQLVKRLPKGVPTIVLIGTNLSRYCNPVTHPRIKLPSPKIPPPVFHPHVYSSKRIQSAATKRRYVQYWLQRRRPEFNRRYTYNDHVLELVVRECKKRGLHPVLLDLPRDLPIIKHSFDKEVSRYHAGCKRLSKKYHIPWLSYVSKCHFVDKDFFDIFHTVQPGRRKFQRLLSARIVSLLKKYHMVPTPSPSPSTSGSPSPSESAGADLSPSVSASP